MIEHWNLLLFNLVNGPAEPSRLMLGLMTALAEDLIDAAPTLLVLLWIRGAPQRRAGLVATGLALLLALVASAAIGTVWQHPRPFAAGIGHGLLAHGRDASFPSDHATVMWTVAFGLMATRAAPASGAALAAAGLLTAWARIWLGVHWPLDMAGALLLSILAAGIAAALQAPVAAWLVPPLTSLYERILAAARLPPAPRRPGCRSSDMPP
jgi:undecaprenyl-diphosphatase